MLMPKRVKRRKQFRGTMKGKALRGNKISYGEFGIVAMEFSRISRSRQNRLRLVWVVEKVLLSIGQQ